jgi:PBP1b-binding outer membrane lipoprotein LpoB
MNSVKKVSGIALASAAAALLLAGCSSTGGYASAKPVVKAQKASMAKVECSGINSCKGKSSCQTASSACKGLNSCKGKGWVPETKANCLSKGGKVGKTIKM